MKGANRTRYTVELADEAWASIEAQIRYIAVEQRAPAEASDWVARLLAAVDGLERMPRRYVLDPQLTRVHGTEIRRMVFERTYLVFYAVDDRARRVNVVSFRHGARKGEGGDDLPRT